MYLKIYKFIDDEKCLSVFVFFSSTFLFLTCIQTCVLYIFVRLSLKPEVTYRPRYSTFIFPPSCFFFYPFYLTYYLNCIFNLFQLSLCICHNSRDDDFPRSRKTDGKRGINHWKRKTYFQTEKHINVLLTTCCTEICNKSYQIQRMSHLFTH